MKSLHNGDPKQCHCWPSRYHFHRISVLNDSPFFCAKICLQFILKCYHSLMYYLPCVYMRTRFILEGIGVSWKEMIKKMVYEMVRQKYAFGALLPLTEVFLFFKTIVLCLQYLEGSNILILISSWFENLCTTKLDLPSGLFCRKFSFFA